MKKELLIDGVAYVRKDTALAKQAAAKAPSIGRSPRWFGELNAVFQDAIEMQGGKCESAAERYSRAARIRELRKEVVDLLRGRATFGVAISGDWDEGAEVT